MKGLYLFGFWMILSTVAGAIPPQQPKAFFVLLGGYKSCKSTTRRDLPPLGIGMYPQFGKLLKTLETKFPTIEITQIAACLEKSPPPEGEGKYVHSRHPKKLHYGDSKKIREEIEAVVEANPTIPVFLIGHSYGGWMSMYLTEELKGIPNIKGLFTVDPIGPDCGPLEAFFGDEPCHQAPTDLDNPQIRKNTAAWVNFYQDEDGWLSSSEIAEAENHHVPFVWGPHSDVSKTDEVWERIGEVVEKALP